MTGDAPNCSKKSQRGAKKSFFDGLSSFFDRSKAKKALWVLEAAMHIQKW